MRRGAGKKGKTCARVRGYTGRKTLKHAKVTRTLIGCWEAWVVWIGGFGHQLVCVSEIGRPGSGERTHADQEENDGLNDRYIISPGVDKWGQVQ